MLQLRRAGPVDAAAVAKLLQDAFEEFRPLYTEAGFTATTPSAEVVRQRLAEGPTWLALYGGEAAGTASAVVRGNRLYMRSMGVGPTVRGKTAGSALLREVERYAELQGLDSIYLSTTPFLDSAIRLYRRFGFQRTAEPPHDLFGTSLFTMEKVLNR
jgi:ribosomal protein S18 acetylase RimI-like enzyme